MSTEDQEKQGSEPTSEELSQDQAGSKDESQNSSSKQGGQGSAQVEDLSVQAGPGAKDFSHPLLRGKTPEEIERLFTLQEQSVRELNAEANRRFAAREQEAAQPARQEESGEDGYGDDFLAPRFRILEKRLGAKLEQAVAPLQAGQRGNESRGAREGLRTRLKHFGRMEPYIDQILREKNVDPNTADQSVLENIYHLAVGLSVERGINLNEAAPAPQQQERRQESPVNIPQHRASSAPLPQERREPVLRQLTESERRLAREYFPDSKDPEGDYRKYQDMNEDDVVSPGFSKELW